MWKTLYRKCWPTGYQPTYLPLTFWAEILREAEATVTPEQIAEAYRIMEETEQFLSSLNPETIWEVSGSKAFWHIMKTAFTSRRNNPFHAAYTYYGWNQYF